MSGDYHDLNRRLFDDAFVLLMHPEDADGGAGSSLAAADIDGDKIADLLFGSSGAVNEFDIVLDHLVNGSTTRLVLNIDSLPDEAVVNIGGSAPDLLLGGQVFGGIDLTNDARDEIAVAIERVAVGGKDRSGILFLPRPSDYGVDFNPVSPGQGTLVLFDGAPGAVPQSVVLGPDIDGDAKPETYFGMSGADATGLDSGAIAILLSSFGNPSGIIDLAAPQPGQIRLITGFAPGAGGGASIVFGQFHGDGRIGMAIGAPGQGVGGEVIVIEDVAAMLATDLNLSGTLQAGITRLHTDVAGGGTGLVLGVGNLDADRADELLIGRPSGGAGSVLMLNPSGVLPADVNLDDPAAPIIRFDGEDPGDRFGAALDVGDFNKDGFDDVLIGAEGASPLNRTDAGAAYLIYGGQDFDAVVPMPDPSAPSDPAAPFITVFQGANAGDGLGGAVMLEDADGDAFAEAFMGATGLDQGAANTGGVYVAAGTGLTGPNTAPIAFTDRFATSSASPVALDLLANDFDPQGDAITVTSVFNVTGGVAVLDQTGKVTFTPNPGVAFGTLDYEVSDARGLKSQGSAVVDFTKAAPVVDISLLGQGDALVLFGRTGSQAGVRIAGIADFNADGIDDYIVTAPSDPRRGVETGSAQVVYGSATTFAAGTKNLAGFTTAEGDDILGAKTKDSAATSAVSADFDGDGTIDLIVDTYRADVEATNAGRAFVLKGKPGGHPFQVDLSSPEASGAVTIEGYGTSTFLGFVMAGAGDVNGDGKDDLLFRLGGSSIVGDRVLLLFGRALTGVTAIDPTDLGPGKGLLISAAAFGDDVGSGLAGGGDFNDDGSADFAIAAGFNDAGGTNAGTVYVFLKAPSGAFNLADFGPEQGFRIIGAAENDNIGQNMAFADVNGDGIDDLVIGIPNADPLGKADAGMVVTVFGREGLAFPDIDLERFSGRDGFIVYGTSAGARVGSALAAGDFLNGNDGIADLLIGAPGANGGKGEVYAIAGRTGDSRSFIALGDLTASDGLVLQQNGISGAGFGTSVGFLGDVTGGGTPAIAVGSPLDDRAGTNAGSATVLSGDAGPLEPIFENFRPNARDDRATIYAGTSTLLDPIANDNNENTRSGLKIVHLGIPTSGEVKLNSDGRVVYTAEPGFVGTVQFTYTIDNSAHKTPSLISDTGTITINIVPDRAPTTKGDTGRFEGEVITIDVLANDSDPEGGKLRIVSVEDPAHGTAAIEPNGTIGYLADTGFSGLDVFTYVVADQNGNASVGVVTVTVAGNNPPTATDDKVSTATNAEVTIAVLANDTDADGDPLEIAQLTAPAHGLVVTTSDLKGLVYEPDKGFVGTDTFTYTVSDGQGGSDTATVTVTIGAANAAPIADADGPYAANEDAKLTVSAANGVLAGDSDPAGDTLAAQLVSTTKNGILALNPDGSFTYMPAANYSGSDGFSYRAKDAGGAASPAQAVTINVVAANDAPDAVNDTAQMILNTAIRIPVLANDIDIDGGDALVVTSVGIPGNGTATKNSDNTITYAPAAGYRGTDSFTYTVSDGNGGSDTATVSLAAPLIPTAQTVLIPGQNYGVLGFPGLPTNVFITGSSAGAEFITIGDFTAAGFSNNFASGGDTVRATGLAGDFKIGVSGNRVTLTSDANQMELGLPVGFAALTLIFETAANVFNDSRALKFVADGADADTLPDLFLGAQRIMPDAAATSVSMFA